MNFKRFIEYLISNKGFVVIDGKLYRCAHCGNEGDRTTFPYHTDDIHHKWRRWFLHPIRDDELRMVFVALDIKVRPRDEQAYILSRRVPQ